VEFTEEAEIDHSLSSTVAPNQTSKPITKETRRPSDVLNIMQAPPLGQYDPYRYGNNNPGQYDSYPLKVPPNAPPGAGFSNGSSLSMSIPPQPRTPSPTPSEEEEARKGVLDWGTILNWRTYAKKKYIVWYIGITLVSALVLFRESLLMKRWTFRCALVDSRIGGIDDTLS
jgi:hypothetical protein